MQSYDSRADRLIGSGQKNMFLLGNPHLLPQFLQDPPLIGRGFDLLLVQHFDEEFECDLLLAVAAIDLDAFRDLRPKRSR